MNVLVKIDLNKIQAPTGGQLELELELGKDNIFDICI